MKYLLNQIPGDRGPKPTIFGREWGERISQLELSGGGSFDSRRRVNSTVRR